MLLVAGFAVADAIRSGATSAAPTTETEQTTTRSVVTSPSLPTDLGRGLFPSVPAGGSVVFAQPGACPIREVHLGTGSEAPNAIPRSGCELWAAPVTYRAAVGLRATESDETLPFRFVDLSRSARILGSFEALFGFIIFSDDGQRAAWCGRSRTGFDLELGENRARRLPDCPAAYTPAGEIAYAVADRLIVGGRTVARASGDISYAHFGEDGSAVVVVDGRRLERYVDGRPDGDVELAQRFQGRTPVLSPDNCSALVRARERMRLVDLGCSSYAPRTFDGTTASWSPDGEWIVVAGPSEITFHDLGGDAEPVTWGVGATDIVWRRS